MYDTCGEKYKTVSVTNFQNVKNEPLKGKMCQWCERLLMFDIYFPHHSSLRYKTCTYANTNTQAHKTSFLLHPLPLVLFLSLSYMNTHTRATHSWPTLLITLSQVLVPSALEGGRDVWPWLPSNDLTDVLIKRKTLSVLSYPQEWQGVCVWLRVSVVISSPRSGPRQEPLHQPVSIEVHFEHSQVAVKAQKPPFKVRPWLSENYICMESYRKAERTCIIIKAQLLKSNARCFFFPVTSPLKNKSIRWMGQVKSCLRGLNIWSVVPLYLQSKQSIWI